ncbi:hypothetical protein L1987_04238 [Smallanthus sonchifolius]|uniref:Uncharacterized protein n=1 Tax=Smallanthus sonchifolius TaxID=185202 RepID=A0ACB9KD57_9ASTR|nr:hypothetical protein L1987_04238 [Smallanthus sonchifolius]
MIRWWLFGWQAVVITVLYMIFSTTPVTSQPQANLLLRSCRLLNTTNTRTFFANLNETFSEVRRQLSILVPPSADLRGRWNHCKLNPKACRPDQIRLLHGS